MLNLIVPSREEIDEEYDLIADNTSHLNDGSPQEKTGDLILVYTVEVR